MRIKITICLLLIGVTAACFWRVTGNGFVNYDDSLYVTDNSHVQAGLSLQGVKWAFTTGENANWHPLTWLSHMLDVELYDLKPWGHHFTSLLLHILNTVLLFLLLARMTGSLWRSGLVAALFGVHPLHVESVAWVAERKDVLSTLFWILTMWAYVRYAEHPGVKRYLPVAVLFALGLSAKPMLVTLPFVLLLLDYWPLRRYAEFKVQSSKFNVGSQVPNTQHPTPNTGSTSTRRLVWEKIPLILLAAASSVVTYIVQQKGGAVSPLEEFPFGIRLANALVSYVEYIGKMFWPKNLAVFYPHPVDTLRLWEIALAGALLIGITVLALAARRRQYLAMGWLWYLGTLVPVIGLVQVGEQSIADRYTYVPLIGLFVVLAWGIPELLSRTALFSTRPVVLSRFLAAVSGIVIILLGAATWVQAGYWRNSYTLLGHAIAVTEGNYVAHYNLGFAFAEEGRSGEAMSHYRAALWANRNLPHAHINLGIELAKQGKADEAIRHYLEALRIQPDDEKAYYNLGNALLQQGKIQEAVAKYRKAIEIKPDYVQAHNNLGNIYAEQGKVEQAIAEYGKAVQIDPKSSNARYNLGNLLVEQGRTSEAIKHYSELLRVAPQDAVVHYLLANLFADRGKLDEAIEHYRDAVEIRPDYAEAHYNLGVALSRQQKIDESVREFRAAVRLKPDYAKAYKNLAVALYLKADYAGAWEALRLSRKYGMRPHPGFVEALSAKMPEPPD